MNQIETHPALQIAVDCAIFSYQDEEIKILLCPAITEPFIGKWSLVSSFLEKNESIEEAVSRIILDSVGVNNVFFKEVHTFSEVERHPQARVVSVLHYALVRLDELFEDKLESQGMKWFSLNNLPELMLDYKEMINEAFVKFQAESCTQLLGKEFLPPFFTLLQLRKVYNCIFQREFEPANFRKKILSMQVLKKQAFKNKTDSKKGAYYYTFDPDADFRPLNRIIYLK